MSSIFDFFEKLFGSPPNPPTKIDVLPDNYISSTVPSSQIQAAFGTTAVANKHYIRIWMTRMLLSNSIDWLTTVYPAVYSAVHLRFGDGDVNLTNVAGPNQLGKLQPTDQGHSLLQNQCMTGLLPFRGGTVQISCGLASMPAHNLLKSFLDTIGQFASVLVQPEVSAGIALAKPIALGVQSLMGAGNANLVLYYSSTFAGELGTEALRSGFTFLSDAKVGSFHQGQLWIIDGEPRIGSTAKGAVPIHGQNFVLLQTEVLSDRDDWDQFKNIQTPLQQAMDAKIAGKANEAARYLVAAKLAAWNSQDLTDADRTRVVAAINAQFTSVPSALSSGVLPGSASVSLGEIMKKAMPVDVALKRGPPTAQDLVSA